MMEEILVLRCLLGTTQQHFFFNLIAFIVKEIVIQNKNEKGNYFCVWQSTNIVSIEPIEPHHIDLAEDLSEDFEKKLCRFSAFCSRVNIALLI